MRRSRIVAAALVALAAAASVAPGSGDVRPRLRVYDLSPVSVSGTRFDAHERLRLVVTTRRTFERRVTVNADGAFRVALRHVRVGPCVQVSVRAYDGRRLRASTKTPPPSCGADIGPT